VSSDSGRISLFYIILFLWVASWTASTNGPVMPLYINHLGIKESDWGLLATFMAAGMVVFEWLWGFLSDRGNRLIYTSVSLLVMTLLFPLYTNRGFIHVFFIFQILLGSFSVSMGPISRSLVSDYSSPEKIGLAMSLWSVFMTLGSMIGSLLGSYIAQRWGFSYAFYTSSLLSCCALVFSVFHYRSFADYQRSVNNLLEAAKDGFHKIVLNPSIRLLLLIAVVSFMSQSVIWSFLPLFASVMVNMSTVEIGLMNAIFSFTGLLASITIGKLSEHVRKEPIIFAGFMSSSLFFLSFYLAVTPFHTYLLSTLIAVSFSVYPLVVASLSELAPKEHIGLSMGIYGSFEDMGMMIGPALYGLIWELFSPRHLFLFSGFIQITGTVLILFLWKKS